MKGSPGRLGLSFYEEMAIMIKNNLVETNRTLVLSRGERNVKGEQMIESGNLLQKIFEDSGAIVLITDKEYCIRYCSSSLLSVLEVDPISIIGKNAFDYVCPTLRDDWEKALKQSGNSVKGEIKFRSVSGEEKFFEVSIANRIDSYEIHGLVIMLYDITNRKNENIELVKKKEHLDQFIFKTTHDLSSPLQTAMGLLNLLEAAPEEDRASYLQMAKNTLSKLRSLIDDANELYRVDKMSVRIEKVDLKKILEAEIDILKNHPQAHNIIFDLNYSETVPLFSDVIRLKTVFGNLLSNAVKYSDSKKEKSFVHIDARIDAESLEVEVSDNGIGIAQENINRIFEIFFRATTNVSGTGLGLHIVKDTITRLNGTVKVNSELGRGTIFKVVIPNLYYSSMKNGSEQAERKSKAVL